MNIIQTNIPGVLIRGSRGSGDRFLNHLYTNKKWHAKQERIQIADSITPTAHLMNSGSTRSINIFKTETNQGLVTCPFLKTLHEMLNGMSMELAEKVHLLFMANYIDYSVYEFRVKV